MTANAMQGDRELCLSRRHGRLHHQADPGRRRALRAGDAERFRRAAHSLKSNGNTFGATALGAWRARELGGKEMPTRRDADTACVRRGEYACAQPPR